MAHCVNSALSVSLVLSLAACAQPQPTGPASLQVVPPSYYSRPLKTRAYVIPSKKKGSNRTVRTIVIEREVPVYAAPQVRARKEAIDTDIQEIQESVQQVQEQVKKVPE